jgi:hypothetical protein
MTLPNEFISACDNWFVKVSTLISDLSRIPIFGKGFAKDNLFKTTEEALKKIASEGEMI